VAASEQQRVNSDFEKYLSETFLRLTPSFFTKIIFYKYPNCHARFALSYDKALHPDRFWKETEREIDKPNDRYASICGSPCTLGIDENITPIITSAHATSRDLRADYIRTISKGVVCRRRKEKGKYVRRNSTPAWTTKRFSHRFVRFAYQVENGMEERFVTESICSRHV